MDSNDGEPPNQSVKTSPAVPSTSGNQASDQSPSGSGNPYALYRQNMQRSSGRIRQKPKEYSPEAQRERTPNPHSAAKREKTPAPQSAPKRGRTPTLHSATTKRGTTPSVPKRDRTSASQSAAKKGRTPVTQSAAKSEKTLAPKSAPKRGTTPAVPERGRTPATQSPPERAESAPRRGRTPVHESVPKRAESCREKTSVPESESTPASQSAPKRERTVPDTTSIVMKSPSAKESGTVKGSSVGNSHARIRQRAVKRFSPSPPPAKKPAPPRRSPNPSVERPARERTPRTPTVERPARERTPRTPTMESPVFHTEVFFLSDLKQSFKANGSVPNIDFVLPFTAEEIGRPTPPPRVHGPVIKIPAKRHKIPNLGVPKPDVPTAEEAAEDPHPPSADSPASAVASSSQLQTPVVTKPPRAAAGMNKPEDSVATPITSTGRPARKAAAGVRELMDQIRTRTPPPSTANAAKVPTSKVHVDVPEVVVTEEERESESPDGPVVRLSDLGAPPITPARSPIPTPTKVVKTSKASAYEAQKSEVTTEEGPKRASRSVSRSSALEESPKSKKSKTSRLATDEPNASSSSTLELPSEDQSIRRSSRQPAPTSKVLDNRRSSTSRGPPNTSTPVVKINIKPGSALAIKKNAAQFHVNRSPTPEVGSVGSSITPKVTQEKRKMKEAEKETQKEKGGDADEDASGKEKLIVPSSSSEVADEIDDAPLVVDEESSEDIEKGDEVSLEVAPTDGTMSKGENVMDEPEKAMGKKATTADLRADSTMETGPKETAPSDGVPAETVPVADAEEPPPTSAKEKSKGRGRTPKTTPAAPVVTPARRSGRGFKPKKFDDFVAETIIRPSGSEVIKLSTRRRRTPSLPPPATSDESAAEKTRKHVNDNRPVKVLMKLGSEVSTRMLSSEAPADESMEIYEHLEDEEEPSSASDPLSTSTLGEAATLEKQAIKKKEKTSRYPSWWTSYTPSEKPILENHVRPDGTVEKMGVTINSVMDKILLAVCQDGITRNSNAHSKQAKSKQLLELAKQRYSDKKKLDDGKKAEAIAQGKEYIESPMAKKTTSEIFAHTIATRDRAKKAALYQQNEYILKPVKKAREAESEKEARERKALDYLSKQFNREAEEDLRHGKDGEFYRPRKVSKSAKKVSFADFVAAKVPKAKEMLMPTTKVPDTFYRELLRQEEEDVDILGADNVDVTTGADEPLPDFTSFEQAAIVAADKISALLVRPQHPDGSFGVSDLYLRIQEEAVERRGLCDFLMNDVIEFFVTQSTSIGDQGRSVLHNEALRHANALHAAFARCTQESSIWAHRFLMENLPVSYMISYIILLRYLKFTAGSSFTTVLVKPVADDFPPWPDVSDILSGYFSPKPQDPDRDDLQSTISPNSLSDVLFVMVPPSFSYDSCIRKYRFHDVIYRWLKTIGDKDSVILELDFSHRNDSAVVAAEAMIRCVKDKVQKLVKERRDKRIVLVGWRLSCYFNHRVVQLTHGVSAIIDLAFPLRSDHGWRGTADDDILLTYCPSLFILGSKASDFNPIILTELRLGMISDTGAVVIHDTDDNLNVEAMTLNDIGITQRTVMRSILETVIDFLQLEITKKERSQLIQHDLNCVYDLDVEALKTIAAQSAGQKGRPPVGVAKPPATAEKPPSKQRKRKLEAAPPIIQQPPPSMPSLQPEATGISANEARTRFDDIIKKGVCELRRPEEYMNSALASFNRPAVRASPLPSPAISQFVASTVAAAHSTTAAAHPGLIDPADISLN